MAQERAEVADEHTAETLPALQNVALVLAHVLQSVDQAIVHLLRAVLGAGLVMEIDDIQSEALRVYRISMLRRSWWSTVYEYLQQKVIFFIFQDGIKSIFIAKNKVQMEALQSRKMLIEHIKDVL